MSKIPKIPVQIDKRFMFQNMAYCITNWGYDVTSTYRQFVIENGKSDNLKIISVGYELFEKKRII